MIRTPKTGPNAVRHLAFLPPGPRLLLGRPAGVDAWDYGGDTLESMLRLQGARLAHLDADAEGRVWIVHTEDGAVQLRGPDRLIWSHQPIALFSFVRSAALSRDGKRVALRANSGAPPYHWPDQRLSLHDAADGAELAALILDHMPAPARLVLAPDGARVASSLGHEHALIWEPDPRPASVPDRFAHDFGQRRGLWQSARPQRAPLRYGDYFNAKALAFSADGATLASVSGARVIVWDVATTERVCTLMGHEAKVAAIAFPPAGPTVASVSADGTLRFWDRQARRHAERLRVDCGLGKLSALAFSLDGQLAAVGGDRGCGLIELDERLLT